MVQLTRQQKIQWRLAIATKPSSDIYFGIHQYTCGVCSKKFFYKYGDPEEPQYHTVANNKKGFSIGIAVCHDCWHQENYKNALVKHSSSCRICEFDHSTRVARRKAKAQFDPKESTPKFAKSRGIEQVSEVRKHKRNGRSLLVPRRRRSS